MKPMNISDMHLPPTLLSSARTIEQRQGLELLVGTISVMHTFSWLLWHFYQTCTTLNLTAVINNQINSFGCDWWYHCLVWCLNILWLHWQFCLFYATKNYVRNGTYNHQVFIWGWRHDWYTQRRPVKADININDNPVTTHVTWDGDVCLQQQFSHHQISTM